MLGQFRILLCCFFFTLSLPTILCADSTLKIGAIASLTGAAGEQGRNWLQGARLAVDELTKSGQPIELIVEDDTTQAARVVSAFHKLAEFDKVSGIVGGTWDYLAEAAYPLALQYKLPFITPTNPPEVLSESARHNPYVFTNSMSLAAEKRAALQFLDSVGARKLGIIYPNLPFGTAHAQIFDQIADQPGYQVLYRYEFQHDGAYLDTVKLAALKISQHEPDIVFAVLDYSGVELFTRELLRRKSKVKLLTTQHLDQAFKLSPNRDQFAHVYGIYPRSVTNVAFNERYRKAFSEEPHVFSAEGYDATMYLVHLQRAGIDIRNSSPALQFEGVSGTYFFPPTNERAIVNSEAVIMTTEQGRFEPWAGD